MHKTSQGSGRSYSRNVPDRPRRGHVHRGRTRSQRGGYRGSGIEFTRVEKGFKFFKLSFIENPWIELEAERLASPKDEEIQIEMDESKVSANGDCQVLPDGKPPDEPGDNMEDPTEKM
ncbi:unnamed protein product [Agarophyton chilense]